MCPSHRRNGGRRSHGAASVTEADTATVGELYQIHVLPTHWAQRIGSQLHATFIQYLHEAALPIGQVEAWYRNHRAQAFYLQHGWRQTDNGARDQATPATYACASTQ
ncbi:GNAT family N-acetyltransferase [Streptomyces sp. NPDC054765]